MKNVIHRPHHPSSSSDRGEVSQRLSLLGENTKPNQINEKCDTQSSPSPLFFSPRRGKSEVVIARRKNQTKPNQTKSMLAIPALLLTKER
jgi:hypothetical protein